MPLTRSFLGLLKPGDYVVFSLGILIVSSLFAYKGESQVGQTLVVRSKGQIVAELPLSDARTLNISGAMGNSVVEIIKGRARVAGDPGPRQFCIKQGWISRQGEGLLCLANQVTLEIPGRTVAFDSLNY